MVDTGLSNHHLLEWLVSADHPPSVVATVSARPWRQLDIEKLRSALQTSPIRQMDEWPDAVNEMGETFDEVITRLLDHFVPIRQSVCRRRPSDPW
jgi:hypothetical protein